MRGPGDELCAQRGRAARSGSFPNKFEADAGDQEHARRDEGQIAASVTRYSQSFLGRDPIYGPERSSGIRAYAGNSSVVRGQHF